MGNYWTIAVGLSFAIHSAIITAGLLPMFNRHPAVNGKKEIREIKITVNEIRNSAAPKSKFEKTRMNDPGLLPAPPYIKNVVRKLIADNTERNLLDKALILEKNTNKIIILEKLENSKLKNNPSYMGYYEALRAKLSAVCQKNYASREQGEVSVNFALSRDGALEGVRCEGENKELIEIATKSVKESFPFLPFPPEIEGRACPFEISILFKNN